MSSLSGCPSGTFKANQGDKACTHCPINSRTTSEGATNCVCRNGYYRADLDPLDMPCTSKSRGPQGRCLTESQVYLQKSSERGLGAIRLQPVFPWWEEKWKSKGHQERGILGWPCSHHADTMVLASGSLPPSAESREKSSQGLDSQRDKGREAWQEMKQHR